MDNYITSLLGGENIPLAHTEIPVARYCPIDKTQLFKEKIGREGPEYRCVTCDASYPLENNEISEEELRRQALIHFNSIEEKLNDINRELPAMEKLKSKLLKIIALAEQNSLTS
ncbi:hypothetical protein HY449_03920 [Candidatus Pacearchaeota archaeon]|nr:hypothetical protein [Candidatus Pacearchaeota archaeon]